MNNNNSISIIMNVYSKDTLELIKLVPGITSVIELFTNSKDEEMKCMLIAYTISDPNTMADTLSKINNIKSAEVSPLRYLINPIKD